MNVKVIMTLCKVRSYGKSISLNLYNQRNYGAYLEKAIQSSLNQTYKNIEIIIIDDSSNDSSHKIHKRFKKYSK